MTSLLEQLPKIVADGKREAERIMERLDSNYRVGLQTCELAQGIVCYVLVRGGEYPAHDTHAVH